MELPQLKIGNIVAKIPIIQGGMAVRVSTAPLAAAVANEGGIGVIAVSGISVEEARQQIREAKSLTKGILGINAMVALKEFFALVKAAIEEGIDLVFAGAGFSRDLFSIGKEANIPIVPIVSSARLAKISERLGAAAIVVEGKEAGGHLGTDISIKKLVPEIRKVIKIPLIAAGGIIDGNGIAEMFRMGANGVQMATRFVLSTECTVSQKFKDLYLKAKKEDVVIIKSPVGLPGRALRNEFIKEVERGEVELYPGCDGCLKNCQRDYCILHALNNAQEGDVEHGVVFCGENVYKLRDILPVKEIFNNLIAEVKAEPA